MNFRNDRVNVQELFGGSSRNTGSANGKHENEDERTRCMVPLVDCIRRGEWSLLFIFILNPAHITRIPPLR